MFTLINEEYNYGLFDLEVEDIIFNDEDDDVKFKLNDKIILLHEIYYVDDFNSIKVINICNMNNEVIMKMRIDILDAQEMTFASNKIIHSNDNIKLELHQDGRYKQYFTLSKVNQDKYTLTLEKVSNLNTDKISFNMNKEVLFDFFDRFSWKFVCFFE